MFRRNFSTECFDQIFRPNFSSEFFDQIFPIFFSPKNFLIFFDIFSLFFAKKNFFWYFFPIFLAKFVRKKMPIHYENFLKTLWEHFENTICHNVTNCSLKMFSKNSQENSQKILKKFSKCIQGIYLSIWKDFNPILSHDLATKSSRNLDALLATMWLKNWAISV